MAKRMPAILPRRPRPCSIESDNDSDQPPVTKKKRRQPPPRVVDSDTNAGESSDEVIITSHRKVEQTPKRNVKRVVTSMKQRRQQPAAAASSDTEEDQDDESSEPVSNKKKFIPKKGTAARKKEAPESGVKAKQKPQRVGKKPIETDSSSDVDDLSLSGHSSEELPEKRARKSSPDKFDTLRLAREKKKQSTVKAAVQNRKRVIESDDDALVISSDSDEDSLQSVRYEPDMTNNDEDLDEFVVSGGEGEEELTEFLDEVRERAQGLMHHLKKFIQLLVLQIISPDTDWLDTMAKEYSFKASHSYVRNEITSLIDTLIKSQAWKPLFLKALDKYPTFSPATILDNDDLPVCDACKLHGRTSRYVVTFKGAPYDSDNFEEASDSDDSDEDPQFNLGGECYKRARIYHQFRHWSHHAYHSLEKEVKRRLAKDPIETLVAKKSATKKERKEIEEENARRQFNRANTVIEEMEERGEIERRAREFMNEIKSAKRAFIR